MWLSGVVGVVCIVFMNFLSSFWRYGFGGVGWHSVEMYGIWDIGNKRRCTGTCMCVCHFFHEGRGEGEYSGMCMCMAGNDMM